MISILKNLTSKLRSPIQSALFPALLLCNSIQAISHPVDVLIAEGTAEVWLGQGTFSYEAPISVILARDARFDFRILNHGYYSDREIVFTYDGSDYYYVIPPDDTMPYGYAYLSSSGEGPPMMLFQDHVRDALWMALGSEDFLEENGLSGEIVNIFRSPRSNVDAYGFRYEARQSHAPFPLAREFTIFKDKSRDRDTRETEQLRIGLDLHNFNGEVRRGQWQWKESWKDGNRAVELTWESEQVLKNGAIVPSAFAVQTYAQHQQDPANPPPAIRVQVRLTSWRHETEFRHTFQPKVTNALDVTDSRIRFRSRSHYVDSISYMIGTSDAESGWKSAEDPSLRARAEARMAVQPIPIVRAHWWNHTFLVILAFGAVVLSIIILYIKRKETGK